MTPPMVTYVAPIAGLVIAATIGAGLWATLRAGAFDREEQAAYFRNGAALLFAWYAISLALSWIEFFRGSAQSLPTIEVGILTPLLIGGWLLWRSDAARRLINMTPQSWIVGVQLYRALGVVFLILLARGELPPQFAWPAGAGDVIVGLAAPFVATAYARGAPNRDDLVYAWNVFGLLDLVVAVFTGFLTSPSPIQMLSLEAPNQWISAFPLVMVPVFAVPVSALLHIVSLIKLHRERRQEAVVA
jgi:hypothetical protein